MPTKLTVVEALAEADDLNAAFHETLCRPVPGDLRSIVSHACLDVAMGHFISMRLLTADRTDVDSTIRALYRPLLETCYRTLWLSWLASDAELEAMSTHTKWQSWPKIREIAAALDALKGTTFFLLNAGDLLIVHDFTHCGRETIFRHYDEVRGIGPSRNDTEIATLILRTVVVMGATTGMLAEKQGMFDDANKIATIALRRLTAEDVFPHPPKR